MPTNKTPYLSVIIPMFNLEDFIIDTLISVVNQKTDYSYEIIVVDDGSTDCSLKLVHEFAKGRDNFNILVNNRSKGASGSRNSGILIAKGTWITFLDGDDIWLEDNINKKLSLADNIKDIDLISSGFSYWYYEDNVKESIHSHVNLMSCFGGLVNHESYLIENPVKALLLNPHLICTGSIMIRQSLLADVGLFNESYKMSEDRDLWLRLVNVANKFIYLNEDLVLYRARKNSLSRQGQPGSIWAVKSLVAFYNAKEFTSHKAVIASRLSYLFLKNAYYYRNNKEYKLAITMSINSVRYNCFNFSAWKSVLSSLLFR